MPASETLAVLRDAFALAIFALAIAAVLYAVVRRVSETSWNFEGNVLTRPYGAPDAVAALFLLGLFGLAFFPAANAAGAGVESHEGALTLSALVQQALTMLLLCVVLLVYLGVARRLNPAEMFGLRQISPLRAFLLALAALILTIIGMQVGIEALEAWHGGELPDTSAQETVEAFERSDSPAFRLMLAFVAIVTAPLTEELLFRGFLYGVVKRVTDRWFAAVFTAMIFSIVHFHVGSAPPLFLLGLCLAIAYEQTGCLLVPIFMHAMFNAWNVAMLVYETFTT